MASCTRNARFELRRNTSSNWTTVNPILLAGEPGVELDTGQMKVGDGIHQWNDLPYVGTGGGSTGPLGFIVDSLNPSGTGLTYQRDLVTFYDPDGPKSIRRWISYTDTITGQPMFAVQLASFTPTLSVAVLPASSVNWDVPATGFSVIVTNPTDFPTQYISSVYSVVQTAGTVSAIGLFTAGSKTPSPAGGVNWTQLFSTNASGVIWPISSSITGGSAAATVNFNYINGSSPEALFTESNASWSITWATPTLGINTAPLSGKTFLDSYSSTTYALTVTGISNSSNYSHVISKTGGTVTNLSGPGTFTFDVAIHKDNVTGITRTVSTQTTFIRPVAVTGTSYSSVLNASAGVSATFTYPSFWIFTTGAGIPPTQSDIVSGTGFNVGVTVLGDQSNTIPTQPIVNTTATPLAFWFGVKSTVSQPTVFKTGASPTLLSDVSVTTGNSVNLTPSSIPAGYSAVSYTLYGITLQPGTTYVLIS